MAETKARTGDELTLEEVRSHPIQPLTGRPEADAIGRKLDWSDPDKARAQQREAVGIRDQRVLEDVERTNRGLPTRWAAE